MADYISREAAINTQKRMCLGCPVDRRLCYKCAVTKTEKQLLELPAADVRAVDEISDSVDEAVDYLNSVSNQIPYHVYSALFDLICGICSTCGADMREKKNVRANSQRPRGGNF